MTLQQISNDLHTCTNPDCGTAQDKNHVEAGTIDYIAISFPWAGVRHLVYGMKYVFELRLVSGTYETYWGTLVSYDFDKSTLKFLLGKAENGITIDIPIALISNIAE